MQLKVFQNVNFFSINTKNARLKEWQPRNGAVTAVLTASLIVAVSMKSVVSSISSKRTR